MVRYFCTVHFLTVHFLTIHFEVQSLNLVFRTDVSTVPGHQEFTQKFFCQMLRRNEQIPDFTKIKLIKLIYCNSFKVLNMQHFQSLLLIDVFFLDQTQSDRLMIPCRGSPGRLRTKTGRGREKVILGAPVPDTQLSFSCFFLVSSHALI